MRTAGQWPAVAPGGGAPLHQGGALEAEVAREHTRDTATPGVAGRVLVPGASEGATGAPPCSAAATGSCAGSAGTTTCGTAGGWWARGRSVTEMRALPNGPVTEGTPRPQDPQNPQNPHRTHNPKNREHPSPPTEPRTQDPEPRTEKTSGCLWQVYGWCTALHRIAGHGGGPIGLRRRGAQDERVCGCCPLPRQLPE